MHQKCDQSRFRYLLYKKAVSYVAMEIFSTIQRKIHPTSSFGAVGWNLGSSCSIPFHGTCSVKWFQICLESIGLDRVLPPLLHPMGWDLGSSCFIPFYGTCSVKWFGSLF
ncbi:hypothetical protein J1N35_045721 [Gossypium stocksii]|uniref:Uncharacterized protein n=1 Tax=Gossypium stocksii TaxID=47602 RepID=A0A9D3ZHI4_9ROSI|nr:hypothetical protein J1N35_045721 [Gossypium stocksii]